MEVLPTIRVKRGEDNEQDYDDRTGFGKKCVSRGVLRRARKSG
jgi:hypothetical protein